MAQLYLNHLNPMNQDQIAQQLHVDRATVTRDVQFLIAEWQENARQSTFEHMARELAEMDQMEREAAVMFQQARKDGKAGGASAAQWYKLRLDTKKRRSDLLGLDKITAIAVEKLMKEDKTSDDKINDLKAAILQSLESRVDGI